MADEITGNLDRDTTEQVYELLREINKRDGTTFIVITHDRHMTEKADRIIEIKDSRIYLDSNVNRISIDIKKTASSMDRFPITSTPQVFNCSGC